MAAYLAEPGHVTRLLDGIIRGDQQAAINLWPWIERAARGHYQGLADWLELDEAINDAYARILRLASVGGLDRITNREELRRFLRWVVYCNLLNQLRRRASRPGGLLVNPDATADVGTGPGSAAMIRDEIRSIFTELGRREPTLAEAIRLRLDGLDDAAIAAVLEVNIRTVRRKFDVIKVFIEQRIRNERPLGGRKEAP